MRKAALERDDYECLVCGKAKSEIGRTPDVHHIVPVRWFFDTEGVERTEAHVLDIVVSLWVRCHRRADHGKISGGALYSAVGIEDPLIKHTDSEN